MLGRGQPERQRVDEALHERITAAECRGLPGVEPAPQYAQGEMVREQLLERQAPPRGMFGVQRRFRIRARRRPVDRPQGVADGDEAMVHGDCLGQQLRDVGIALQPVERLVRQAAQQRLPQAHGRGIDRRQAVAGRRRRAVLDQPVLRMHHLDTAGRGTDFAITRDAPARPELPPLVLVEVEQPHRHRRGAVADGDDEGTAAPETDPRVFDPAARQRGAAGVQVFDGMDTGAILVPQGEMEQQVEHRLDPERRELRGGSRSDPVQFRDRRRFQGRRRLGRVRLAAPARMSHPSSTGDGT